MDITSLIYLSEKKTQTNNHYVAEPNEKIWKEQQV